LRYLACEKPGPEFCAEFSAPQGLIGLAGKRHLRLRPKPRARPLGVKDYGFRVVIIPSYAAMFYNNCWKNGSLPATLPEEQVSEREEGYSLRVNLPNQTIADNQSLVFKFETAPSRKEVLLKARRRRHRKHPVTWARHHRLRTNARHATMYDAADVKYNSNGRLTSFTFRFSTFNFLGFSSFSAVASADSGAAGGPSISATRIPARTISAPSIEQDASDRSARKRLVAATLILSRNRESAVYWLWGRLTIALGLVAAPRVTRTTASFL
jgi:hypothetical protein